MSNTYPHRRVDVLPPEVLDRSLTPPDHCVMHRYPDGTFGWRFNPQLRRSIDDWARAQNIALSELAKNWEVAP